MAHVLNHKDRIIVIQILIFEVLVMIVDRKYGRIVNFKITFIRQLYCFSCFHFEFVILGQKDSYVIKLQDYIDDVTRIYTYIFNYKAIVHAFFVYGK